MTSNAMRCSDDMPYIHCCAGDSNRLQYLADTAQPVCPATTNAIIMAIAVSSLQAFEISPSITEDARPCLRHTLYVKCLFPCKLLLCMTVLPALSNEAQLLQLNFPNRFSLYKH